MGTHYLTPFYMNRIGILIVIFVSVATLMHVGCRCKYVVAVCFSLYLNTQECAQGCASVALTLQRVSE